MILGIYGVPVGAGPIPSLVMVSTVQITCAATSLIRLPKVVSEVGYPGLLVFCTGYRPNDQEARTHVVVALTIEGQRQETSTDSTPWSNETRGLAWG
jgi:hypothetical protein